MAKSPNYSFNRPITSNRSTISEDAAVVETLRNGSKGPPSTEPETRTPSTGTPPWFIQVFGGTLLSIMALACITVFNYVNSSLSDLRRDISQHSESKAEYVKKTELESKLAAVESTMKDLSNSVGAVHALNERARLLDQQMERQLKSGADERKDLTTRLDEQRKLSLEERKELSKKIDDVRGALEQVQNDNLRRLEEVRKLVEDERKDLHRKLEAYRKQADDQRSEFTRQIQALGERLAAIEGRHAPKTLAAKPEKSPEK